MSTIATLTALETGANSRTDINSNFANLNADKMEKSNNLSDVSSVVTARSNLGLGTLATQNGTFSGTSSGTNTGDQTITLTGDVTGSGTGSFATTIGAGKVTNAMLAGLIDLATKVTGILTSAFGGTGNGFTKFTGPTTSEKTFTLPDANSTIVVQGGALGTPSSGTATNLTGLPVSGITSSTTQALGVGSLEIGHASDTTLARASAGVASIEGNNIVVNTSSPTLATITTTGNIELGNASDTTLSRSSAGVLAVEGVVIPSISSTNTITNKRYTPRVFTTANTATLTPEIDTYDIFHVTALSGAITIANKSTSTPTDGELMEIRLLDNGTARAISFGTDYVAKAGTALPTTTVLSKNMCLLFEWNANLSKWNLLANGQEA